MAFYYLLLLSRCGVDFICIPSKLFLLLFYVNHQHITAGFFSLMCVQVFLFSFVVVVSGQKFNVFSCPLSHTIRFNTNQMNTIIYTYENEPKKLEQTVNSAVSALRTFQLIQMMSKSEYHIFKCQLIVILFFDYLTFQIVSYIFFYYFN